MDVTPETPQKVTSALPLNRLGGRLLQRKCACGGSPGIAGECEACQEKQLTPQRYSRDRATLVGLLAPLGQSLISMSPPDGRPAGSAGLGHNFGLLQARSPLKLQTKSSVSQPTDQYEQEADRVAEQVTGKSVSTEERQSISLAHAEPKIQRAVAGGNATSGENSASSAAAETEPDRSEGSAAAGLIVEDEAREVGSGQMRKSEFLAELSAAVYATADVILKENGRSAEGCPYITNWIGYGYTRSGSYVETFVRRFAPGADRVASARDYIPLIRERIRFALLVWAATGEIIGVPEDLASELPDTSNRSAVESLGTRVATEGAVASAETVNTAPLLKARDGGQPGEVVPQAIQRQLGAGNSLDSHVKSRMEAAFGYSFSRVRVHHDSSAAHLSTRLNARAFTVGNHVAFGAGEYKPGTPIGDALLAHELAHVVQQGGAQAAVASKHASDTASSSLEEEADRSAIGAVVALWGGAKSRLANIAEHALPRLRSGLRLSRCKDCGTETEQKLEEDQGTKEDAGAPKTPDGGETPKQPPAPSPGTKSCTSALDADKIVVDHRVDPSPAVIEKPGDKVKFTVTFACTVPDDGFSKIVDPAGNEFRREKQSAKGKGQIIRDWDGTKLFPKIGTYLVDDGNKYIHRLEPIKYGYKYDKKSKKSNDLMTTGPKHDSPPVKVGARAYKGAGPTHFHYTTANADALADILESEVGIGNDDEKKAVAWSVRNQMIRFSTGDVTVARDHFGDAHDQPAKPATKTLAEEILKKPMSDDITSGAIKWYSPKGMLELENAGKNVNCRGGRTNESDDSGKTHSVCSPDWRKTMSNVSIPGARNWYLKVYKLN